MRSILFLDLGGINVKKYCRALLWFAVTGLCITLLFLSKNVTQTYIEIAMATLSLINAIRYLIIASRKK